MSRVFYQDSPDSASNLINASSAGFILSQKHKRLRRRQQQAANTSSKAPQNAFSVPRKTNARISSMHAWERNVLGTPSRKQSTLSSTWLPSLSPKQDSASQRSSQGARLSPYASREGTPASHFLPRLLQGVRTMQPSESHLSKSFLSDLIYNSTSSHEQALFLISYLAFCRKKYAEALDWIRKMVRGGVTTVGIHCGKTEGGIDSSALYEEGSLEESTDEQSTEEYAEYWDLRSFMGVIALCWVDFCFTCRYGVTSDVYEWLAEQEGLCRECLIRALGEETATESSINSAASLQLANSTIRKHLRQTQGIYYVYPNAEKYLKRKSRTIYDIKDSESQNQVLAPITALSLQERRRTQSNPAVASSAHSPSQLQKAARKARDSTMLGMSLTSADTYQECPPAPLKQALKGLRTLREWRQKMDASVSFIKHPKDEEEILTQLRKAEKITPQIAQLAQIHAPHEFFGAFTLRELFVKVHCNTGDLCVNLLEARRCVERYVSAVDTTWGDELFSLASDYDLDPITQHQIPYCALAAFEQWFARKRRLAQFVKDWNSLKEFLTDVDVLTEDFDIYTFALKQYRCKDNVFHLSSCPHQMVFTEQTDENRVLFFVYLPRYNLVHYGVSESQDTYLQLQWRFGEVIPVFVEQVSRAESAHVLEQLQEVLRPFLIANSQYAVPVIELKTLILQELPSIVDRIDTRANGDGLSAPFELRKYSVSVIDDETAPQSEAHSTITTTQPFDSFPSQMELRHEFLSLSTRYEEQQRELVAERERIEDLESQLATQKEIVAKQDDTILQQLKEMDNTRREKDQLIQELQTANNHLQRHVDEKEERERYEVEHQSTILCLTLRGAWFELREIAPSETERIYVTLHTLSESGEDTECQSSSKTISPSTDDSVKHIAQWEEECLFISMRKSDSLILRVWMDSGGCIGERTWSWHHITFWNQATDIYSEGETKVRWSVHVKLTKALPIHMIQYISELHKREVRE